MIKGFTLVEMLVVLALMFLITTVVVSQVVGSSRCSQKIINNQQRMEAIFHTVDAIRSDLTKCGMRLQEASTRFGFPMFEYSAQSLKVLYGVGEETLQEECLEEDISILINRNEFFTKRKGILIYDTERGYYEFNEINGWEDDRLILVNPLQHDYSRGSSAVVLKQVEYKIYPDQKALKRKVNRGYFQPIIEEVTDFNVKFFPEAVSVLYKIEVNNKEQIRGYIFLSNMVEK